MDEEFNLVVFGEEVCIKVWIHFFIGDTKGNNKWLGQYPVNREGVQQPYCNCKFSFQKLSDTTPTYDYFTLNDIHEDKRHKRNDEDGGKHYFRSVSRYDIKICNPQKIYATLRSYSWSIQGDATGAITYLWYWIDHVHVQINTSTDWRWQGP